MNVTKQSLGHGYLVGAGVVLTLALLGHAYVALGQSVAAALVAVAGLVPALALVAAHYWLPRSGLEGHQIWTVAEWGGLGIAALTLVNVALVATGGTVGDVTPVLLAASVALAGCVGILVGALLELRGTTRRLSRSNDVLNRILRHNLRNDLNVVMGHLSALEPAVSGPAAERIAELDEKVEDIVATVEKARQIDTALAAGRRRQQPLDMIPVLEKRVDAIRRANPDAEIQADLPDEAWVEADWFLGTVVDNVVENAVDHSGADPRVAISVAREGDAVRIRVRDEAPAIPDAERAVFESGRETPLEHSTGVGLWLVQLVVDGYGGDVSLHSNGDGGNEVVVDLPAATNPFAGTLRGRLQSTPERGPTRT